MEEKREFLFHVGTDEYGNVRNGTDLSDLLDLLDLPDAPDGASQGYAVASGEIRFALMDHKEEKIFPIANSSGSFRTSSQTCNYRKNSTIFYLFMHFFLHNNPFFCRIIYCRKKNFKYNISSENNFKSLNTKNQT